MVLSFWVLCNKKYKKLCLYCNFKLISGVDVIDDDDDLVERPSTHADLSGLLTPTTPGWNAPPPVSEYTNSIVYPDYYLMLMIKMS